MDNQKLENILNLALAVPEEEREQSLNLNVGFVNETKSWELIMKYHGNLTGLEGTGIQIEDLIAGYAIVTIPENLIRPFSELEEVEYIEKPKRFFWSEVDMAEVKGDSCILPVILREPYLTGHGTIVTVIDSGIDYRNRAFLKADGTTRILRLWDQTLEPSEEKGWAPPEGFLTGVEFDSEAINQALRAETVQKGYELVPSRDISGHGTAVAAIAAGAFEATDDELIGYQGIAPEADLVIVKLGMPRAESFPRTIELMRALTYAVRTALMFGRPTAVNLSFGNTYGNHAGDSLLERFIDNIAEIGRNNIIIGSGNEGASLGHITTTFLQTGMIECSVGAYETSLSIQIWLQYEDDFQIQIISPNGSVAIIESTRSLALETGRGNVQRRTLEDTNLLLYVGEPLPYTVSQEIYLDMLPRQKYVKAGIWQFVFIPRTVVNGQIKMYLPSESVRSRDTLFFRSTPDMTLTIPSTARKAVTVGAYNSVYQSYADFSGRGYVYITSMPGGYGRWIDNLSCKPDIVAPGVEIESVAVGGGIISVTGTSFATPIVTGSCALMMEWGIVQGNDPFLYGEKVKAYLRKGAKPLPGFDEYPNPQVGWGALCVRDSLPF